MKDSQDYILIQSLELRHSPWITEEGSSTKLQEGKYRSFNLSFKPGVDEISMLIHFKHLKIYNMNLKYQKKNIKNRKTKKVYQKHKMRLFFDNTIELLTYLSSKKYKILCFDIRFTNGWIIRKDWFNQVEFITNNTIERNSLLEKLIAISGQVPIDINLLKINNKYTLSTNGKVNHKPLFFK